LFRISTPPHATASHRHTSYKLLKTLFKVQRANHKDSTDPVASLRSVSPGAATDGVTIFFVKKLTTCFSHRRQKVIIIIIIIVIIMCAFLVRLLQTCTGALQQS